MTYHCWCTSHIIHENFYHVLENDRTSNNVDVITQVLPTSELLPTGERASSHKSLPETNVGDVLVSTNDYDDSIVAQTHTIPVYAVPDKVRSKVMLVANDKVNLPL